MECKRGPSDCFFFPCYCWPTGLCVGGTGRSANEKKKKLERRGREARVSLPPDTFSFAKSQPNTRSASHFSPFSFLNTQNGRRPTPPHPRPHGRDPACTFSPHVCGRRERGRHQGELGERKRGESVWDGQQDASARVRDELFLPGRPRLPAFGAVHSTPSSSRSVIELAIRVGWGWWRDRQGQAFAGTGPQKRLGAPPASLGPPGARRRPRDDRAPAGALPTSARLPTHRAGCYRAPRHALSWRRRG